MDQKLFKAIHHFSGRCSPIDVFMIFISNKIRYVFILVLIFMWFRNKSYKKIACHSILSAGITFIIHWVTKLFYYEPRPFIKRRVGILIPSKTDSTFLSKHTLLVFAISTSILIRDRVLGLIMSILSLLTGFSRIWVGVHYPSDIMRSMIIATMTSFMVETFKEGTGTDAHPSINGGDSTSKQS